MNNYFIIFPHAGAIKSGYTNIVNSVAEKCEIIYVDYDEHLDENSTFGSFIESIWEFLGDKIKRKNWGVYIFAHSMGNCIVQALESRLLSQYFVEEIIYSDGEVINNIQDNELRKKSEEELQALLDEKYDIPEEIKENEILLEHFQNILLRDLFVLDKVPHYVERVGDIYLEDDVERKILISNYMEHERVISDWNKICEKKKFIPIFGSHYDILDNFSKYIEI
ncbi:MAG: hypothetical protein K2N61_12740 [Lachnospiraceae bacterium]|nr:hypothetical protein [Lachnospiraceae bacterium]